MNLRCEIHSLRDLFVLGRFHHFDSDSGEMLGNIRLDEVANRDAVSCGWQFEIKGLARFEQFWRLERHWQYEGNLSAVAIPHMACAYSIAYGGYGPFPCGEREGRFIEALLG